EANALRLVSDIRSSVLRVHLRRTRAVSDDAPRAGHHGGRRGRRSGPWQEGCPSIEDSFSSLQGVKPSTSASYRSHVDSYITPRLGALALSTLRAPQLNEFYADLLESGRRSNATSLS